jgi:hypothetical protein
VLFVLPKFPAVAAAFWSLPIVQTRLGAAAVTPLDALLIVLVVGRVLLAPQPGTGAGAAAAGDADTAATRFEGAVTAIALGLACALLVYPAIAAKTVTSIASIVWGAPPPPLRPTVVLLLAALATGITLERARLGLRAPIDQRRAAVVRNGSTLVSALTLMALAVGVYPTLIVTLHAGIGPALKPMFLGLYQQQSLAGFAVSNTIAVIAGVITGVACAGAAAMLRRFADATERFFVDAPGESLAERTA